LLAGWSAASVAGGATLWANGDRFGRYAGVQFVAWGAIDGLLAGVGLAQGPAERARARREGGAAARREAFRRVLLVNAIADAVYVAGGALLLGLGRGEAVRGTGAGILAQGGFLLAFDGGGLAYFW
jgi:hypothetical protein